jgi:hypothetical protein
MIGHGLGAFIEVGRALLEIQHGRLYLPGRLPELRGLHERALGSLRSRPRSRQIEAARVIDLLSPTGESLLPANEAVRLGRGGGFRLGPLPVWCCAPLA